MTEHSFYPDLDTDTDSDTDLEWNHAIYVLRPAVRDRAKADLARREALCEYWPAPLETSIPAMKAG